MTRSLAEIESATPAASPIDVGSIRIETERLVMRPPVAGDFNAWADLAADEQVMQHLGGVQPRSVAWRHFVFAIGSWHVQGFCGFSVIERATGAWVGRVGPLMPEGWPGSEVGWTLARPFWGKGYAVEAARAAIDWAFDVLDWSEVIHCISETNSPSQAVASKLGSRKLRTATMPAPYDGVVVDVWGQSNAQWRARRSGVSA